MTRYPWRFLLLAISIACISSTGLWENHAAAAGAPAWRWQASLRGSSPGSQLKLPTALYVDESKGRYYVVDSGAQRLVSFDREGKFLQTYAPEGGLVNPYDLVRLASGELLVVEKGKNSLTLIDLKNKTVVEKTVSHRGRQIFVDRLEQVNDAIYVLDKASGDIFRLDEKFLVSQEYPAPRGAKSVADFQVINGKLWLLGQMDKRLYQLDLNGKLLSQHELGSSLSFPVSFTVDRSGNFYVLDRHLGLVVVYDQQVRELYRFLGKGHLREKLYYPNEIRFDPWGRLCVVDEGNGRIEIFSR